VRRPEMARGRTPWLEHIGLHSRRRSLSLDRTAEGAIRRRWRLPRNGPGNVGVLFIIIKDKGAPALVPVE